MKGKSVLKVEKGKLLKVFLDFDQKTGSIREIKITGDFFMHPEEGIEMLERELEGATLDMTALRKRIGDFFRSNEIRLFGIDAESLAKAIMNCAGDAK